jgi:preprotein translocase subunit SecA
MAGRGTDIVLGGSMAEFIEQEDEAESKKLQTQWRKRHDEVLAAGGLRIIGSERHESRRIDNQLRGRAGRQGDPGSTRFYLSLEDNLMRIFASDRVAAIMRRLGMQAGEPIEHGLVTKAIENAQRKLEGHHFDIRKQLLEYDNVANEQRKVMYSQRAIMMEMEELTEAIDMMRAEVIEGLVQQYIPLDSLEEQWDVAELMRILHEDFQLHVEIDKWIEENHNIQPDQILEKIMQLAINAYQQKRETVGPDLLMQFERSILLQTMDNHWREHLAAMDHVRQGIHLRGYAQKDPKQEYKREAFALFSNLLDNIRYESIRLLSSVEISTKDDVDTVESKRRKSSTGNKITYLHPQNEDGEFPPKDANQKIGRNDQCWCGSGKKYKQCHGQLD